MNKPENWRHRWRDFKRSLVTLKESIKGPEVASPILRRTVTIALILLAITFVIVSSFVRYNGWLLPITNMTTALSVGLNALGGIGILYLCGMLRKERAHEPAGWLYLAFLGMMLVWWGTSLVMAGRCTVVGLVTTSPTFITQSWLTYVAAAFVVTMPRPWRLSTLAVREHFRWWVASVAAFFGAMVVMVADTDYQRFSVPAANAITPQLWLNWRILNYALIVPFLLVVAAVVNGKVRLSVACGCGLAIALLLFVLILASGGIP